VPLAIPFRDAVWFNPLNGEICPASYDENGVEISLRSGESMILQTWDDRLPGLKKLSAGTTQSASSERCVIPLNGSWTLSFIEEAPRMERVFTLDSLQTWEKLDEDSLRVMMGTGVYTTQVKMTRKDLKGKARWRIDLGDVRESARVYINGQFIGCAWSVPFVLDCKNTLKAGRNEVRIEVTNLPANRIRDLDRRGVKWRKMTGINLVDIHYKPTTYDQWDLVPSGLNSEVKLFK
jgi:hypothetical protein